MTEMFGELSQDALTPESYHGIFILWGLGCPTILYMKWFLIVDAPIALGTNSITDPAVAQQPRILGGRSRGRQ